MLRLSDHTTFVFRFRSRVPKYFVGRLSRSRFKSKFVVYCRIIMSFVFRFRSRLKLVCGVCVADSKVVLG